MTDDLACRDVVELLTAFLDDALDAETMAVVGYHLKQCPGCEIYLQQLHVIIKTLAGADSPPDTMSAESIAELTRAFRETFQ